MYIIIKMRDALYSLDILNYKPSLNFKEKPFYGTNLGIAVTFITGIAVLVLGIYFLKDCTDRKRYVENTTDNLIESRPYTFDDFNIAFTIKNGREDEIPELSRLVNFQFFDVPSFTPFFPDQLKKCNVADLLANSNLDRNNPKNIGFYCIPDHMNKTFTPYEELSEGFLAIFYPCQNKTLDDGSIQTPACYPEEEIYKRLTENDMYLYMRLIDKNINHDSTDNKDSTFEPYVKKLTLRVSLDIYMAYVLNIQPVQYDVDDGYILENVKTYNSYRYVDYSMQVDSIKNSEKGEFNIHTSKFAMFYVVLDDHIKLYRKDYIKLQTVAANIDGVSKLIIIVFQTLFSFYSKQLFYLDYGNSVVSRSSTKANNNFHSEKMIISNLKDNNIKNYKNPSFLENLESRIRVENINPDNDLILNKNIKTNFLNLRLDEVAIKNTTCPNYIKIEKSTDFYDRIKSKYLVEKDQVNNLLKLTLCNKLGFDTKDFKLYKKMLDRTLSIEKVINNITELVHFKNYFEEKYSIVYVGNGIDYSINDDKEFKNNNNSLVNHSQLILNNNQ